MAFGPGKYDDECKTLRLGTRAEGAIIIVINGDRGTGFSAQLTLQHMLDLPTALRHMADQLELEHKGKFNA